MCDVCNLKALYYSMRNNYCQACSFAKFGVKTRKHISHTCGSDDIPKQHQYYPKTSTREELDMYLKRLKELMDEDL